MALASVSDNGSLGSIVATNADVTGVFSVSGSVNHVTLGNLNGGTFAASGAIGTMRVASLTNAFVLSGASPGRKTPLARESQAPHSPPVQSRAWW